MQQRELSPRQLEVLQTVALTGNIGEAAQRLGIAPATVQAHLETAKDRLGMRGSFHELVVRAIELGLVPDRRRTPR